MPDLKQALKDFVATSNSGKYSDEKTLMSKFPELKGYDVNSLRDYVATSNSGKYKKEEELNSKFPEFFSVKKKVISEPTSQEKLWGSSSKPKDVYTTLVTDVQKKGGVLASSNGTKLEMKTFKGFSKDDLSKMKSTSTQEANKIKTPKPKENKEDKDFIDYVVGNTDLGIAMASKSIYDTPSLVYEAASLVTNPIVKTVYKMTGNEENFVPASPENMSKLLGVENIPSKILKEKIGKLNQELEKQSASYGGDPLTAIQEGRYSDAAKLVVGTTLQSLPAMAIAAGTGGGSAGLYAIGITTSAQKNEQLKEEHPELSAGARITNSLASGALEATFGHVFTGATGSVVGKILRAEGKAGGTTLKNAFVSVAEKNIMKNPVVSFFGEVLEEGGVEFGNQMNDMATGIRKELDTKQIYNASISAMGMGVPGTLSVYGAKGYMSAKAYTKVKSLNKEIYNLQAEISKPGTSENSKKILATKMNMLIENNKQFFGSELEKLKGLSPEDKGMINKTNKVIDEVKDAITQLSYDSTLSPEALKISKEELYKDYVEAVKKKNSILSKVSGNKIDGDFSNFNGVPIDYNIENEDIHTLPIEKQNELNRKALSELNQELNPTGTEQVDITQKMVSDRVNEINKESVVTEKQPPSGQKVSEFVNRTVTLYSHAGSKFDTPLKGDLYTDGQRLVFEDRNKNVYDLGNAEELSNSNVEDVGIRPIEKTFEVVDKDNILVDGNEWGIQNELPNKGIEFDKAGNIKAVSLKNKAGNTVMHEGQVAEDIGYQILLSNAESKEQREKVNKILEEDESINGQFREAEKTAEETANKVVEPSVKKNRRRETTKQEVDTKVSDDYVSLSSKQKSLEESLSKETNGRKKKRLADEIKEVSKQKQELLNSDEKMSHINKNIDKIINELTKKGVGKPCKL